MSENNIQGNRQRALGDLTNVLGKRPASLHLEKDAGAVKICRGVEQLAELTKRNEGFKDVLATAGGATGNIFGHLFDGVGKENSARASIFRGTKVQHMAAEAAGLLSKEIAAERNHGVSLDSSGVNDKEESSLESEGGCGDEDEDDDDDDDMDSELLAYTRESSKMTANDGECLTQEEMVVSSENQNPLSSVDFTTGDGMPCSSVQHTPMAVDGSEESGATKSCACSFCLKAAFMWTDLHYQDTRSRHSALKKSIKFARSLEAKNQGNEYAFNAGGHNSKRAAEMVFELSQQQRSLFLFTENVLLRESSQLHSALKKLKDLRENCKTDLDMTGNSLLEK